MNKIMKTNIIAAAICAMFSGVASADPAETKGGIKIKSEDGRFEAGVGGRIHFDGNLVSEDEDATFGSSGTPAQSGFYFRRIYMTLSGKLYGWKYKIEGDFAPNNTSGATNIAFQDVFLATDIGPGELQIGQRKAFRSMEDLTSSNDVLMIERPFASGSGGLFKAGTEREFQQGLFYSGYGDNYTWGTSFATLRGNGSAGTEGIGESARVTFTPVNADGTVVHLGLSYSAENPAQAQNSTAGGASQALGAGGFAYAGRRGPSFNLGTTTGHLNTIGVELAGVVGPFFAQAEYMTQKQDDINAAGASQTINAYYVQGSFFVTGESKPYKSATGVFGSAKPSGDKGAIEITARYDFAENSDFDGVAATSGSSCAGGDKCEISAITVGANYYVNPNVRFMLNYIMGTADKGSGGKDEPKTVAARAQLSF